MQQNQDNRQGTEDEVADEGIGVGTSKQSKITIIILIAVFVSAVIYFMFLKEKPQTGEEGAVNELIIGEGSGEAPIREGGIDYNATDILDVSPIDNLFAPKTQDNLPSLPELPELPDSIKQQIASSVTPKKEQTFTKDEVDQMIDTKLKEMMERQMEEITKNANASNTSNIARPPASGGFEIPLPNVPTANKKEDQKVQINVDELTGNTVKKTSAITELNADGIPLSEEELLVKQQKEETDNLARIQKNRALQERKALPIFKMSGGTGPENSLPQDSDAIILTYTDAKLDIQDKTPDVLPTQITDLTRVILQGKVISAVLETAVDTDLAASVRAVITRDVYAEEGKNILIPRGSRVIGTYTTDVAAGQSRVTINWNRIIRVDGMSLNITSIGADRLGRAGIQGELDNKYAQQLANSFLSSVLSVGTSLIVEKLNGSTGITNTISSLTGETTTTSGRPSDYALIDATQQFMDDAQKIVDDIAQQRPVIRIPQGEKVIIMVTQDVTLPIFKRGK